MTKYIVTFDKSNEDIPTLIVGRESYFALGPGTDVVSIITGDKAIRLFNELSNKAEKENVNEHNNN